MDAESDGSNGVDVLEQSGIVRSDIRSSLDGGTTASGVPMALSLTILDMAGNNAPFADVAVYVWHCDSAGGYSMYSAGLEYETYLRGVQVADDAGKVSFTSIFPACYPGRWPHVHFEVYPDVAAITDSTNTIATSQLALPHGVSDVVYARSEYTGSAANLAELSLASDNVFGDDGGAAQLATVTGDADTGYLVSLTVRVDTDTAPTAGAAPGGRGSGGRGSAAGSLAAGLLLVAQAVLAALRRGRDPAPGVRHRRPGDTPAVAEPLHAPSCGGPARPRSLRWMP